MSAPVTKAGESIESERATEAPPPVESLRFLMRSGNSFVIDGVEDWEMRHSVVTGRVTFLRLTQNQSPQYARAITESVDLAQIEAIVRLPARTEAPSPVTGGA